MKKQILVSLVLLQTGLIATDLNIAKPKKYNGYKWYNTQPQQPTKDFSNRNFKKTIKKDNKNKRGKRNNNKKQLIFVKHKGIEYTIKQLQKPSWQTQFKVLVTITVKNNTGKKITIKPKTTFVFKNIELVPFKKDSVRISGKNTLEISNALTSQKDFEKMAKGELIPELNIIK